MSKLQEKVPKISNYVQITEIDYHVVTSVVDFRPINLKNVFFSESAVLA